MTDRREFLRFSTTAGGVLALGHRRWNATMVADVPAAAKPLRLLILGGTGLTGPHVAIQSRSSVAQEDASKNFEFLYGRLKTASEREATKWFGANTTIIRPGLMSGLRW